MATIEPHLQVPQIPDRKPEPFPGSGEELLVAWIGIDLVVPLGVENASQERPAFTPDERLR